MGAGFAGDDVNPHVLHHPETGAIGNAFVGPGFDLKLDRVRRCLRGAISIHRSVPVVGNQVRIQDPGCSGVRCRVGLIGNGCLVPCYRYDLVQGPTKRASGIGGPPGICVNHPVTVTKTEEIPALVVHVPAVVRGIKNKAREVRVHFGSVLVAAVEEQSELSSKEAAKKSLAIVVLFNGQWRAGSIPFDRDAVLGVSLDVTDIQIPAHATPPVFSAGGVHQRRMGLTTVARRRPLNGNRVNEAAGEQVGFVLRSLGHQGLRLVLPN